jgi:hypothetical protein
MQYADSYPKRLKLGFSHLLGSAAATKEGGCCYADDERLEIAVDCRATHFYDA